LPVAIIASQSYPAAQRINHSTQIPVNSFTASPARGPEDYDAPLSGAPPAMTRF
jgi:hypothetical protein